MKENFGTRPVTWCARHAKDSHGSRRAARKVIRAIHDPAMRPYRCDAQPTLWHIGHLPWVVRRGQATASDIYGDAS